MKRYSIEDFKEIAKIMKEKNINLREALKVFDVRSKKRYNVEDVSKKNK